MAEVQQIPTCNYRFVKGAKAGVQCDQPGRYNGKCCRHKTKIPGSHAVNVSSMVEEKKANNTEKLKEDEIFNDMVQEKQPDEPKHKSSVWRFTINSNTDYDKMTKDDKLRFRRFMEYVFDENGIFDFLADLNSINDSRANVDEMNIEYYFENSSKNLLHAHGILRIKHHGCFRLKLNEIRNLARTVFGKNIHIDAPVSSDYDTAWEEYIKKHGVAGKLTLE